MNPDEPLHADQLQIDRIPYDLAPHLHSFLCFISVHPQFKASFFSLGDRTRNRTLVSGLMSRVAASLGRPVPMPQIFSREEAQSGIRKNLSAVLGPAFDENWTFLVDDSFQSSVPSQVKSFVWVYPGLGLPTAAVRGTGPDRDLSHTPEQRGAENLLHVRCRNNFLRVLGLILLSLEQSELSPVEFVYRRQWKEPRPESLHAVHSPVVNRAATPLQTKSIDPAAPDLPCRTERAPLLRDRYDHEAANHPEVYVAGLAGIMAVQSAARIFALPLPGQPGPLHIASGGGASLGNESSRWLAVVEVEDAPTGSSARRFESTKAQAPPPQESAAREGAQHARMAERVLAPWGETTREVLLEMEQKAAAISKYKYRKELDLSRPPDPDLETAGAENSNGSGRVKPRRSESIKRTLMKFMQLGLPD